MDFILIERESPEWQYMWEWLAQHPINEGITEPTVAEYHGEAWQYMGSVKQGDKAVHSFRHRNHPRTNLRYNLELASSATFTPDQIKVKQSL